MTRKDPCAMLDPTLTDSQHKREFKASKVLLPLLSGRPVTLTVSDVAVIKRKRIKEPVVFITPSTVYGLEGAALVISVQGGGCEIIDRSVAIKPMSVYRTGLSMRASRILASELNILFQP